MDTSIYAYDDYRKFLSMRYEALRANPAFSTRAFALRSGFSDPGFFRAVISGRRKLSAPAVEKMIAAFTLSKVEAEFFRLLVAYGQTRDPVLRAEAFREILARRNKSLFAKISPSQARYYQDWRYPLIRNAVEACDFRGDFAVLSEFLKPSPAVGVIEKVVTDLVAWGLIACDNQGRYRATQDLVRPPETLSATVRELNKEWIRQAVDASDTLAANQYHVSSALVTVSEDTRRAIEQKIENLRNEVFALTKADTKPECVMLLNVQFIPKTRTLR